MLVAKVGGNTEVIAAVKYCLIVVVVFFCVLNLLVRYQSVWLVKISY